MANVTKNFTINARTLLTLGRDSVKDHVTAILELVKNSYDADATKIEIDINIFSDNPSIRVADNGCGMSEKQIEEHWLRIGYSAKRNETFTSQFNRRKTGEKGIGRLSADRLGAILCINTKSLEEKVFGLKINWKEFEKEGVELSKVPVDVIEQPQISIPGSDIGQKTGTEIVITELRHQWNREYIINLRKELSVLVSPFDEVTNLEISLNNDLAPELNGIIKSEFYENAETDLTATFDEKTQTITYKITERLENKNSKEGQIEWTNISQKVGSTSYSSNLSKLSCGNVTIKILFYLRDSSSLEGTNMSLNQLRSFLDSNAGVKIYRDNIRVKPYGDPGSPEGDWLELGERKSKEPAGVARARYRVSPTQIIGAVFVGRDDNPELVDSSSREGLIKGQAFNDLRALALACITLIESFRHKNAKEKQNIKRDKYSAQVTSFKDKINKFEEKLNTIANAVPSEVKTEVYKALNELEEIKKESNVTEKSIAQLLSEKRVLGGLATLGIASAVFGHETQSAISQFNISTNLVAHLLNKDPLEIDIINEELEKARSYARKVSEWGAFALTRVQREKREHKEVYINKIVEKVIKEIKPIFDSANIEIILQLTEIKSKLYAMDIEAILLNLLTNSYTACTQNPLERKVKILVTFVNISDFQIIVSDTGNGVDDSIKEQIWEPLFTTKKNSEGKETGTGLGLTVVQSILNDLQGSRNVKQDDDLGGAQFIITLPRN